jgi:uncharacterized protein (TIGR02145 family)
MKQKLFFLALTLFVLGAASMNAQVRIGGADNPHSSAVLDLNANDDAEPTGNLGLSLPRVSLTSEKQQLVTGVDPLDGTIIYNTNVDFARGKGIYFWTDSLWLRAGSTYSMREGDTIVPLLKPAVKIIDNPAEGIGALFGLDNYADLGSTFRINWTVTANGSPAYTPVLQYTESPVKRDIVFVPYDQTNRTYTVTAQAIADGYNDSPVSDALISEAGIFTASYDLLGESYYDIAQTDYDDAAPSYPYGIMAYRTPYALNTANTYTYEIVGTGSSPTYNWSVAAGSEYLANAGSITGSTDSSVGIQFNSSVLSDESIIDNPTAHVTVTLTCQVIDGTYNKTFTKNIEIGDRDVCIPTIGLTDAEGNSYTVYRFGNSGCWMTQNLRSTKTLQAGVEKVLPENNNGGMQNTPAYYFVNGAAGKSAGYGITTNLDYGLLYSWSAANIGTLATENTDAFFDLSSDRQGICPGGWVLPSDYDFALLEKEVASNPQYYSAQTTPYADADTYDFYNGNEGWRPAGSDQTFWGRQMKSPTSVTGNPNGASNTDGTGFNALLVGIMNNGAPAYYGTYSFFWSSSAVNATIAEDRALQDSRTAANRGNTTKANLMSVRCKKN